MPIENIDKNTDKRILNQFEYIEKIRMINKNAKKFVYSKTFGCAQNSADMSNMLGMCRMMGYDFCQTAESADIIIFNTCAVREHAEKRVLGNIGALKAIKQRNPKLIIIIAGCMVQQEHIQKEIKQKYKHIDILLGPQNEYKLPESVYNVLTECGDKPEPQLQTRLDNEEYIEDMPRFRDNKYSVMIPVISGCNNFCSYCIVPHVRGRERSRRHEKIIAEFREAVESGAKNITLLGQNVNSYGRDIEGEYDFSDLLSELCKIPGEFIINFMTSHPKDAGVKLIDTIAANTKISRWLHLPFQAGNDGILKEMNRNYTVQDYIGLVNYAREKIPDLTLTSDVIVGFPGETYEQFCDTLRLIEKIRFDGLYTFIYSKRSGTPASVMPDQIDEQEKKRRFNILLEKQNEITKNSLDKYLGKTLRVFCEGVSKNQQDYLECRTNGGKIVHIKNNAEYIGKFINVKINRAETFCMFADVVN